MCPARMLMIDWNSEQIKTDILMPNGLLLTLKVNKEITLEDLKEESFYEAHKLPLFGVLHAKENYLFTYVNSLTSLQEELHDEDQRLCDVRPFLALLRLIEKKVDKSAKQLDRQIGILIGKNLREFDALKCPEVNYFRGQMRKFAEEKIEMRKNKSWIEKMLYYFPIQTRQSSDVPEYLKDKLKDNKMKVNLRFQSSKFCQELIVSTIILPDQLIQMGLANDLVARGSVNAFLVKINGRQEYLLKNLELIRYKPILEMISNDETPYFVIVEKAEIKEFDDDHDYHRLELPRLSTGGKTLIRRRHKQTSWEIKEPFVIQINSAHQINFRGSKVKVKVGLFHGGDSLCNIQETSAVSITGDCGGDAIWNQQIIFDIRINDIPRMARVCFSLIVTKKEDNILAWVNTNVFDFKGILNKGTITFSMWNSLEEGFDSDEPFHPLGTVFPNPSIEQATCLTVTFCNFKDQKDFIVHFPTIDQVLDDNNNGDESCRQLAHGSKQHLVELREISEKDLLTEICEQDLGLFWRLREDCCCSLPNSLPKLLLSFKWNEQDKIREILTLINKWPKLNPEKALELLDYAYADCHVRRFAIDCLRRNCTDEQLSLYLLQLVQALKYESYLYCDLVEFLLERAFNNQRIGHQLFWLLRSEMHMQSTSVKFGVILEAYCRGAIEHMKVLLHQTVALNKLKRINEAIKFEMKNEPKERRIEIMHKILEQRYYKESLSNFVNPLDPSFMLGNIQIKQCKFMDSKMKPLFLVFTNEDYLNEDEKKNIYLIFKNGDDLRQDMLTLQMIRIMDKIWKDEGLDLKMSPYRCISTDDKVGLIEVVLDANTIANIQREKAGLAIAAFRRASLFEWLKEHNPRKEDLEKAIERFTLSCAGYCVATYVLGIADRHNDNVMVKKNGQLFHIDFGHILGNFKEKFGIRRERVPFVLTNHFVHVITQDPSDAFERFRKYCEDAFMILRKKGSFIIALFAMMLSSGIPEVSSVSDLDYLRETLVLDLTDDQAKEHFQKKITYALDKSWQVAFNWGIHNFAKDNR